MINKKKFSKRCRQFLFFALFAVLLFVPRYFAHLEHDTIEDEILSIDINNIYSFRDFFFSPDISHPGFWYMLMEIPTHFLGIIHGIFYYRLIQVVILFVLLSFSIFYFKNKLPKSFLFIFLTLFLTNVYFVHITFQHRMYSLVLGIAVFYSLFWYYLIKKNHDFSMKTSIFLGLIASLGFFSNFSMVWIIPLWPLAYFLYKRSLPAFKTAFFSSATFLLSISWFMPKFVKNAEYSIAVNQWAPPLNFQNTLEMIGNFFGIIPRYFDLNKLNILVIPFLILFVFMIIWLSNKKKNQYILSVVISLAIFFLFFILAVYLTDRSLLYARTSITFAIIFYIIIADIYALNSKLIKSIVYVMIVFQISQFFIYFADHKKTDYMYYLFDYRHHPVAYFANYNFEKNSCIIPMPYWNYLSLRYFLGQKVKVIPIYNSSNNLLREETKDCSVIYMLNQTSVDKNREDLQVYYQIFSDSNSNKKFVDKNNDQSLYILNFK